MKTSPDSLTPPPSRTLKSTASPYAATQTEGREGLTTEEAQLVLDEGGEVYIDTAPTRLETEMARRAKLPTSELVAQVKADLAILDILDALK